MSSNRRLSKLLSHITSSNIPHSSITSSNDYPLLSLTYPSVSKQFTNLLGNRYTEDDSILIQHGREVIGHARSSPPAAVLFPLSTKEVVQITTICNNHSPPIYIIPYAAGSSLESHIIKNKNRHITITISFAKMDQIIEIYPDDMQCTVQPGVNWVKLNKQLSKYGLFLGVDPAPAACIGGMVATCCSGPSALRYGTMRNQVINLTVVLSDGRIICTGQRAIKSVAGYDLNSLFCGSEGTLCIITEITLRLRALPKFIEIAQASFDNLESIGKCVAEINAAGINLAAFEYLDENMLNACKKYDSKVDLVLNSQVIMFKFCGPSKQHILADINLVKEIVNKYTKSPFLWSKNEEERIRIWKVRKMAFWAAKFANPGMEVIVTDVAVPFSNFNASLIACKKELDGSWLGCVIVGHIGDGNWHACIFFDKNKEKDIVEANRLNNYIVETAIKLEGTCTAEHGVGKHKKKWLKYEMGQNSVEFMQSLKRHIDPNCILNPGNIVQV